MAKIKERNQVPPPSEDTARKMAIYEPGSEFLTRYQIYWCLHLKLTASKTRRNKCPLFINKQQNSKGSKKKTVIHKGTLTRLSAYFFCRNFANGRE